MSRPAEHLPRYTYADYASWPEDVRGELDGGVFHAMNAPTVSHQRISMRLSYQLQGQLRGQRCEPFAAPTDVLFVQPGQRDEDCTDVAQPDLFIVCNPDRVLTKYIRGAPDFVLEILSTSTRRRDQVRKLALYEREGVREYWLLDPEARVLTVYTLGADARFGRPLVIESEGHTALHILPEVAVNWDDALG